MKTYAPIHIVVHSPTTTSGKKELSKRVASIHADMVTQKIQTLTCPSKQKTELLEAVINTIKKSS